MAIVRTQPLIDRILESCKGRIGEPYEGYRGHVFRVFNFCLALRSCTDEEIEKLAIAAAFHDIGLWSDHTADYLPPSVAQARQWLADNGLEAWSEEIGLMIEMHHKLRPYRDPRYPLVEVFRKADLVDFSLGAVKFGLPSAFVGRVKSEIPNAGFHRFLFGMAKDWFARHPLSVPPFIKW